MPNIFQQANKNLTNAGTMATAAGRTNSWQKAGTGRLMDASSIADQMMGLAGPNAIQTAGMRGFQNAAGPNQAQTAALRTAAAGGGMSGYEASAGRGFGGIAGPGSMAMSMNQFMNPYVNNVMDNALARIREDESRQMSDIGAQAAMQGAFGGSRHAVLESEAMDDFNQRENELISGMLSDSFSQAGNLANAQQQNQLAANQGMMTLGGNIQNRALNAAGLQADVGATLGNQQLQAAQGVSNIGNQVAANDINAMSNAGNLTLGAGQALTNAGNQFANNQLGAAGALTNLGVQQDQIGQQANAAQAASGAQQRGLNQAVLDFANQQFGGYVNHPNQMLDLVSAMFGSPLNQNQTQTQSNNPGLFQYLGLGLQGAGTFYKPGGSTG